MRKLAMRLSAIIALLLLTVACSAINVTNGLTINTPPAACNNAVAGYAYSCQLTESNGTAPFKWTVTGGSLPPGITLNPSTGLLSGTPSAVGTYVPQIIVTDSSNPVQTSAPVTVDPDIRAQSWWEKDWHWLKAQVQTILDWWNGRDTLS